MKNFLKNLRYKLSYLIAPDWIDDLEFRFSSFLCEQTGGKLSKCYYSLDTMRSVAEDYCKIICDEEYEVGKNDGIRICSAAIQRELEPTMSVLFQIGEVLVAESKQDITPETAIRKIREKLNNTHQIIESKYQLEKLTQKIESEITGAKD